MFFATARKQVNFSYLRMKREIMYYTYKHVIPAEVSEANKRYQKNVTYISHLNLLLLSLSLDKRQMSNTVRMIVTTTLHFHILLHPI